MGGSFVFSGVFGVNLLGVLADLVRVLDAGRDQVLQALECVQFGERFVQVVAGDVFFLDEEFDEQCRRGLCCRPLPSTPSMRRC